MPEIKLPKGYRILVTREKKQASGLVRKIEANGGVPLAVPLLEFVLPDSLEVIQETLMRLDEFNWLIFTSQNGVDFFFSQYEAGARESKLPKIAVIGNQTKKALLSRGLKPDFVPDKFVAEEFARQFVPHLKVSDQVLIAKGNLARPVIAEAIRTAGTACEELTVYQTKLPDKSGELLAVLLKQHQIDAVTFTSSSTVHHFMKIVKVNSLQNDVRNIMIVCIGPIAKHTAEQYGLTVHVCPDIYTADAMIDQLSVYLQSVRNS
ncbi:uroporphyrinogen-III synthase [Bacillus sp. OV322]|uniref:uroporphyrinogen-III synthase n=1 Tax=Bacillus sp. OV322 TaxID=1882764 RepID=UPI0008DEFBE2|nr:uroporphyrinogen-III synthase [Bacillus sp. OV322]SFC54996.1 uroporphyrinogen-III synthase [Bacillus sp. OV322]